MTAINVDSIDTDANDDDKKILFFVVLVFGDKSPAGNLDVVDVKNGEPLIVLSSALQ
jgi:hypothetical protein